MLTVSSIERENGDENHPTNFAGRNKLENWKQETRKSLTSCSKIKFMSELDSNKGVFCSFSIKIIIKVKNSFKAFAFFWPYFFFITLKAHSSFLAFTFFEIMLSIKKPLSLVAFLSNHVMIINLGTT